MCFKDPVRLSCTVKWIKLHWSQWMSHLLSRNFNFYHLTGTFSSWDAKVWRIQYHHWLSQRWETVSVHILQQMASDCLKKNKLVDSSIAIYLLLSLRPHTRKSSSRRWQDAITVSTSCRGKAENTTFLVYSSVWMKSCTLFMRRVRNNPLYSTMIVNPRYNFSAGQ